MLPAPLTARCAGTSPPALQRDKTPFPAPLRHAARGAGKGSERPEIYGVRAMKYQNQFRNSGCAPEERRPRSASTRQNAEQLVSLRSAGG